VSRKVNAAIQQVDIVIGTHKLLSSDVQFERWGS
jgi:transcription-repair coupling factor (superfamily II helicase)